MKLVSFQKNKFSLKLLYLLLATDMIFVILNILYLHTNIISSPYFFIEQDRGYAELFQYIKEYWIVLMLGVMTVQKRSPLYFCWSIFFFYLLLDDSMEIHEKLGGFISDKLGFSPALYLRAKDFGEIFVSVFVGLLFLVIVAIAYRYGNRISKEISRYIIAMLFALAFFGIVVDTLHIAIREPIIQYLLGTLEDGGEMVTMSIITSFVYLVNEKKS